MKKNLIYNLFIIFFSLLVLTKHSQLKSEQLWTLHDLQKLALKNDSRQQALKLEKKVLLQQKKARLRRYLPSVNLSVQRDRVVANSNSDQTSNHWQIQINQPIYDGGRNQIDRKINLMQIQNLNDRAKILQSQIQLEGLSIYLETMTEYQQLLLERGEKKNRAARKTGTLTTTSRLDESADTIAYPDSKPITKNKSRSGGT